MVGFKLVKICLLFFGIIILGEGCSIYGHYSSVPNKGRKSSVGYDIVLTKNQSFIIKSWTGCPESTTIKYRGHGTFTHQNDSLTLSFLNEDSIKIKINKSIVKDTAVYRVRLYNELWKPIGPTLHLVDNNNKHKPLPWTVNDIYIIKIPETASIRSIIINDFGYTENPEILLTELKIGDNLIKRKTFDGYYAKGDTTTLYCKRTFTGIRRGPKKRWLAKKYKTKWINKLYPN